MAEPISKIRETGPTLEEQQAEHLQELKDAFAKEDSGFKEMIEFVRLLNEAGALEAVNSAVKAKEEIAKTFLNEWRKEPTTNAINNLMLTSQLLTETKPEQTEAIIKKMKETAKQAEESAKSEEIIGLFGLMKALKDPDVNRALRYGLTFLKGMGENLK
ncbi:DUF1641 domain-containing protein [Listeria costaricensis]|uniref:DUF1641 domain-containing protein n=1 Tax=Listeria costaricensis TaxID=2026604 RepID=UPI000C0898CB|nr:DUF1641 domain-containing protein [Listeria costaricensis]